MAGKESNIKIILTVDNTQAMNALAMTNKDLQNIAKTQRVNATENSKIERESLAEARRISNERKQLKKIEKEYEKERERDYNNLVRQLRKEEAVANYGKQRDDTIAILQKQAGTARYAITNLNRAISDAPYFMRGFDMGIIAISNNLDPLVQSFAQAADETGGFGAALKSIGKQMLGTGGILLAFSLINAAITTFALKKKVATEQTKEQKEALKKENEELEKQKRLLSDLLILKDPLSGKQFTIPFDKLAPAIEETKAFIALLERVKERRRYDEISAISKRTLEQEKERLILKQKLQQPLEYKGKTLTELPTDITDLEGQLKRNKTFSNMLEQQLKDFEEKKKLRDLITISGGEPATDKTVKETKEIKNEYMSLLNNLQDEYQKYKMTEYDYSLYIEKRKESDTILSYKELLKEGKLNKEEMDNLILKLHENYLLRLEEIDTEYLEKQSKAKAKAQERQKRLTTMQIKKEMERRLAELREEYKMVDVVTQSAANTLVSAFSNAWQEVFGEANSLLEQFLSNTVSGIASLATKSLSEYLFSSIIPFFSGGTTSLIAGAAGGSGSLWGKSMTLTNVVVLDGQVIDKRVANNFGNYSYSAANRRLM